MAWKPDLARRALAAVAALGSYLPAHAAGVPPTTIGIHLTGIGAARALANLAAGGRWVYLPPHQGWSDMPKELLTPNGQIAKLPPGGEIKRVLSLPDLSKPVAHVRCTYSGRGTVTGGGLSVNNEFERKGSVTFDIVAVTPRQGATINVTAMDPADPVRDIDCREKPLTDTTLFAPKFLDDVRGFKVLRFMDWQNTNNNPPAIRWATRNTPSSGDFLSGDGVPVEYMVALANEVDADAWFNTPWNADDDYIEHFARYVHDHLAPAHHVYVETSNEVWNEGFPVAHQATAEGLAEKLSTNPGQAKMFRYAERSAHVLDIWARVFADRPGRLVRVFSTQADTPFFIEGQITFRDTLRHIDAIATAPYFYYDRTNEPTSLDEIYRRMPAGVDHALELAVAAKAVADKHGKRSIAYEAGQSIIMGNVPLARSIQLDPRMHDMYKRYLDGWRTRIGDTIIMFGTVLATGPFGSWGLKETEDDTEATSPKLRAVREELRAGPG